MIYDCCNENRKAAVLNNPELNGIDYLEVLDHAAIALASPRQQTLLVYCLKQAPANLSSANVVIAGGESITTIGIQWISPATTPPPEATAAEKAYFTSLPNAANILVIRTDRAGDFSPYTLRLVNSASQASEDPFEVTGTLAGFDPQLAEVQFSFKVECGPDFDCKPAPCDCPPDLPAPPPINYLTKDYGSFRSIMLDRLSQLLPGWNATSEADLGIALAELIAYVGDRLSYQQDAVATEAWIETARSRISLRRHALLVDYRVHDGANARAWVALQVNGQVFMDRRKTQFYTSALNMPSPLAGNEEKALLAGVKVFEPMQDAVLHPEHNQMRLYTWGDTNCCLPQGATEATLLGSYPNLRPGDVLIFQEVLGPQTGNPADADIRHRAAVRLTQATTRDGRGSLLVDPLFENQTGKPITAPAIQQPTPVTEIQWSTEDALPFPVCLSSTFLDSNNDQTFVTDVSVALGNIVLADHGLTFSGKSLGTVPQPALFYPPDPSADRCRPSRPAPLPVRFRPQVLDGPVTQAVPLPLASSPVTPGIVMLQGSGFVSLTDSGGFVSLMVQPDDPFSWPQFFGVLTRKNSSDPANTDLLVVYNPPGGAQGVPSPVTIESFTNLSFNKTDSNYVATQINSLSKLIQVPASYVPPASTPSGYPAAPVMLPNTGALNLLDTSAVPYLTVEATNPAVWPQYFGVLSQGNQQKPDVFNLVVVYNPSSGGVGVNLPVTVELFSDLSLATAADAFTSASELISLESFADEPNPSLSAFALMNVDASAAFPVISLTGTLPDGVVIQWSPRQDLLESVAADPAFVIEVESNSVATLRFGDGVNGAAPQSGTAFVSTYRVGNGTDGNVGAESLVNLVTADARIVACSNPLPAFGGADPETNDQIRRRAPQAFLTQERAVTMPDYAAAAELSPQVEQAVATLRWTGSWYTVFIGVEPFGGANLTPALDARVRQNVEQRRLAGQDFELESPDYVSLDIQLTVCVDPDYFQRNVQQGLLQALTPLFAPDNFTFGQAVFLSPIYAAARTVPGVVAVTATRFQPQGVNSSIFLSQGEIKMGPFQVARLANDPSFPGRGRLELVMLGGK